MAPAQADRLVHLIVTKTFDRLLREKILSFNGTGKIEYTHAA